MPPTPSDTERLNPERPDANRLRDGVPDPHAQTVGTQNVRPQDAGQSDIEVIPVVQESVRIEKRAVETGRVVVHKTVTERDETVEAMLARQDLSVERIPVNRVVTEAPAPRQDGDTLVIPVLEEVLVVEKRLVLKEELHIRTANTQQAVQETVRLRSEQVTIEQTGGQSAAPIQSGAKT